MTRKKVIKREVVPDPRHQSKVVAKFINHLMKRGKKTTARRLVYEALDRVNQETGGEPVEIFKRALRNVRPKKEVRSKRVGGANYQVPYRVDRKRGMALAMRWIIRTARKGKGRPMKEKLAEEIMDAAHNKGGAVRKKINVHRMAKANKAFAYLARYT